jgi:hypothetical protein
MKKSALVGNVRYRVTIKPADGDATDMQLLASLADFLNGDPRSGKPEVHELPEDWESTL